MSVEYLGDVHLGKVFQTGVPLHRRGDRERLQWGEFEANLFNTTASLHIQVGDLFDKMIVPYSVVYRAAMAYREAVKCNPDTTYAVIRGNHDASRDADRVSAFQLFTELVRPFGVVVANERPVEIEDHVLIPWHPFKTAEEMITYVRDAKVAVGHWDVVMGDDNHIPAVKLKELGVIKAVTGHDHNQRDLMIDGLPVHVTGSMQPYSHGEDQTERFYVTRTLDQVLVDPGQFKNKCLRILMGGDDVLDQTIDCLQLTTQRETVEGVDLGEVDFEAFDLHALFDQAREEVGLDADFGALVLLKLEEERSVHS